MTLGFCWRAKLALLIACSSCQVAFASTANVRTRVGSPRPAPLLAFEANRGQYADGIAFVAYAPGLTAALAGDAVAFAVPAPAGRTAALRMKLVGGQGAPQAGRLLPGRANYLVGSQPSGWTTGVPLYGQVTFAGVYPGVDVVYHGDEAGRLQYDFVVHPGADPDRIGLAFEGSAVKLDAAGNLHISSGDGRLVQTAPVLYQVGPEGSRSAVSGSFALAASGQVRFQVGAYDRSRPLVIDPVSLGHSTFLGTEVGEEARDVAVDAAGNSYVVGTRIRPSFDPFTPDTRDAFVAKYDASGSLVYLTYVGGTTGTPIQAPFLHAPGDDEGDGIAIGPLSTIDPTVVAYITGWTTSTDFPLAGPAFQTSLTHDPVNNPRGARQNAFLAKVNAHGTGLLYSTYVGRSNFGQGAISYRGQAFGAAGVFDEGQQYGRDLAVDAYAIAYVVGDTAGIQAIAVPEGGPYPPNDPYHISDAFLHRFNLDPASASYGTVALDWNLFSNHHLGLFGDDYAAQGAEIATGVALSPDRDVFVTGHSSSTDLYTSDHAFQAHATAHLGLAPNLNDAFLVQLDGPDVEPPDDEGIVGGFEYATYLGGGGDDRSFAITVDPLEHAFVAGGTNRDSFPTTAGAYQQASTSAPILEGAAFVSKLPESGSALSYSTLLGGNTTLGFGVALDESSRAYVTGHTLNPGSLEGAPPPGGVLVPGENVLGTFPLTADATDASSGTGTRAFLTALDATGSSLLFSTFHGSRTSGQAVAVHVVSDETTVLDREAVVVGSIDQSIMPVVNATQPESGGLLDGFVARWNGFALSDLPGPTP